MNARVFDPHIERLRSVATGLPNRRTGDNTQYLMADIALSACAVFFTQCPSFLSFQQKMEQARGRNNARSLFQVERIPTDNHIRQTLDPVEPHDLFSLFDDLRRALEETGVLENMRAVGGTRLIALDATWYFSSRSKNIHCPNCSSIRHAEGQTTHFHSAGPRQPGPQSGRAAAPGVHHAAGWASQTGLRNQRGQALARRSCRA
ncbi:MAG: hypothetical protein V9H26_12855 [Verrucomicrobiota bacterium]